MITKTQELAIALCVEKLKQVAAAVDNDPDEIARFLGREGITGLIGAGRACPIANYIYKNTPNPESFTFQVSGHTVVVYEGNWPKYVFPLDRTTSYFIMLFDNRNYPSLIDGG